MNKHKKVICLNINQPWLWLFSFYFPELTRRQSENKRQLLTEGPEDIFISVYWKATTHVIFSGTKILNTLSIWQQNMSAINHSL